MQFTSLFPIATSLALASAGIVSERQFEGDVAVLKVFDYNTTNCVGDESTVDIGVGPWLWTCVSPFLRDTGLSPIHTWNPQSIPVSWKDTLEPDLDNEEEWMAD
ncbi:hypothetical protein LA080_014571 [Diaporthe eres]|nr:hypothetical protein LA080_014571 [Diaporthe eres]